jgi:hypothetical protein
MQRFPTPELRENNNKMEEQDRSILFVAAEGGINFGENGNTCLKESSF